MEEHLENCRECQQYFEKISRVLLPTLTSSNDILEADPYLVTRVMAIGRNRAMAVPAPTLLVGRWVLRSSLFAAAVLLGIYMGEKLSYQPTAITDQKIIAEYSALLDASGIGDRLQTVAQSSAEASK